MPHEAEKSGLYQHFDKEGEKRNADLWSRLLNLVNAQAKEMAEPPGDTLGRMIGFREMVLELINAIEEPEKVNIVCCHCGSNRVMKDAWARWDIEKQAWVFAATFDKPNRCESCNEELGVFGLQEIPADTPVFRLEHCYGRGGADSTFVIWNHDKSKKFGEFADHAKAIAALTKLNRKAREKHKVVEQNRA